VSWPTPGEVREALSTHRAIEVPALPGRRNDLRAGVLVPLVWEPDPVVLLTLRGTHLRRHAGEVSFPGGRAEPGDVDLEATALREAREELGIVHAEVLGRLSSMPLYTSDFRLVPYVASVDGAEIKPDPEEVSAVLRLRVLTLLELPQQQAIPWNDGEREHLSPVFFADEHAVYGGTAHSLWELLQILAPLFGRGLPPLVATGLDWSDVMVWG
jgi:8-oxo-dGTP pyrophosphatase MutT (NUDIX family)